MKPIASRRERIEEVIAVIIPFMILAFFAVMAPRLVAMVAVDPPAAHATR